MQRRRGFPADGRDRAMRRSFGLPAQTADLTPEGRDEAAARSHGSHRRPTLPRPAPSDELLSAPTRQNLIDARDAPARPAAAISRPRTCSRRGASRSVSSRARCSRASPTIALSSTSPASTRRRIEPEVPCVLEDGRWRIEIPLPPPTPVERRPEPGLISHMLPASGSSLFSPGPLTP